MALWRGADGEAVSHDEPAFEVGFVGNLGVGCNGLLQFREGRRSGHWRHQISRRHQFGGSRC